MKTRKITIAIFTVIIIIALVIGVKKIFIDKSQNNTKKVDEEVQKLYEYGNEVESMDFLPNTIVARFNGEEILFHEIELYRKSINFSIENGNTYSEGKNAFYEVLVNKLYSYLAKKYPNETTYHIDIKSTLEKTKNEWENGVGNLSAEEYRKELLDILAIKEDEIWLNEEDFVTYLQNLSVEQTLSNKGMNIVLNFMINRPELVNDETLNEKVRELNQLSEQQNKLANENKTSEALELSRNLYNYYNEVRELYVKDLIVNSNIELCVDKRELSKTVPTIYKEENNEI